MDSNKYNRTIEMHCPTCGGTEFKSNEIDGESLLICTSCDLQLMRDDLRQANGRNIAAHVDDVKTEIVKDVQKALALRSLIAATQWLAT